MANAGGAGGAVVISYSSTGSTVSVHFPADPNTVPPQTDHTDIYVNPEPWALHALEQCLPPHRADVVVTGAGAPSTVTTK